MDPLSIASSIVAILQATGVVVNYGVSVYNARRDREELGKELELLKDTIQSLQNRRSKGAQSADSWYQGFNRLVERSGTLTSEGVYEAPKDGSKSGGPLAEVFKSIAKLRSESASSQTPKALKVIGERITFYWDKDKIAGAIANIKNARDNINFILAQDQWDITQAIQVDGRDTNIKVTAFISTFEDNIRKQGDKERRREEIAERVSIKEWLSPLDFLARQEQLSEDRFDTGQWLLNSPAFKQWVAGRPWHLRCYGEPGSGKTVLSSIVVDYLRKTVEPHGTPVICLYLDHKETMTQTKTNLFGSLLRQLLDRRASTPLSYNIREYYQRARTRQPMFSEIERLLEEEIATYGRIYLVVDALDACPFRQELIKQIRKLQSENLSVLVTSRRLDEEIPNMTVSCDYCPAKDQEIYYHCNIDNVDICQTCKDGKNHCTNNNHELYEIYDTVELNIITPDEEIERYVKWIIQQELGYGSDLWDDRIHERRPDATKFGRKLTQNPNLIQSIPPVVVAKARCRILDAKLCMDALKTQHTPKGIQKTLDGLPDTYEDHYDNALLRIKGQKDAKLRALGLKTLSCIACAHRVLTLEELQHALAIEPDDVEFDEENICDKEDILASTAALISIDLNFVRAQNTLEEYLSRPEARKKWLPEAEADLATTCLTYLSFDALGKPSRSDEEFDNKRREYPFLAYASQFWGDHVRDAGANFDASLASRLVNDPRRVDAYVQAAWYTDRTSAVSWDVRKGVFDLHVCAWFGLSTVLPLLDEDDIEIDIEEPTYDQTPLMYACRNGHVDFVRALLDRGASINRTSSRGKTAMFEAIEENHEGVVELLLSRGGDLDINAVQTKDDFRTALMLAASLDQRSIVACLMERPGIDIDKQDVYGWTALSIAIYKGFTKIVETLLQNSHINTNLVLTSGHSPLSLAVMGRNTPIVELLLQKNADPYLKDAHNNGNAILLAAEFNCVPILEAMQKHRVDLKDVKIADDDGRGPLHHAAENGCSEVVHFLSRCNLALNAQDHYGLTPLHLACSSRKGEVIEVVEILLGLGAKLSTKDQYNRTPLEIAWQYGYTTITSILKTEYEVSRLIHPQLPDSSNMPLWSLAKLGLTDILSHALRSRKTLQSEVEPVSEDTGLHWAVTADQLQALRVLLQYDSSPFPQNRYGRTPLHIAAVDGNLLATAELLAHLDQAGIDIQDRWGLTSFYIALRNQHYRVALALVEAGAVVDIMRRDLQKLFFAAVDNGSIKATEILLEAGADVLDHNVEGLTALQLAKDKGDVEMQQVLRLSKSYHHGGKENGNGQGGPLPDMRGGYSAVLPFRVRPTDGQS